MKTCLECRWSRFSGPHLGCFHNGKYRKWIPRPYTMAETCEDFESVRRFDGVREFILSKDEMELCIECMSALFAGAFKVLLEEHIDFDNPMESIAVAFTRGFGLGVMSCVKDNLKIEDGLVHVLATDGELLCRDKDEGETEG